MLNFSRLESSGTSTLATVLLLLAACISPKAAFATPLESAPEVATVTQHVIKDNPIVVQTPLQNYEQPTLKEYDECHKNREKCLSVCDEDGACLSECPLCPELYNQPLVVQGVNDTGYLKGAPPVNTTNIIKLTNEINNIIHSDIKSSNINNVKVEQNISQVGGRFGLGYDEHGSCCLVVRRIRDCKPNDHCKEHKRVRVCGERCQARVMLARPVVQCDAKNPQDCHETIEYVPARKHRKHTASTAQRCTYMEYWPYIHCPGDAQQQGLRMRRSTCDHCYNIPYGLILKNGLPMDCIRCYHGISYGAPRTPQWFEPYARYPYPGQGFEGVPNDYGTNDFWDAQTVPDDKLTVDQNEDSGWVLESQKCMNADGKLEDCMPDQLSGSGDGEKPAVPPNTKHESDSYNDHLDEDLEDYDFSDDSYNVPIQRRRRRNSRLQLRRSAYSHRND